jgi:hypothetical protein
MRAIAHEILVVANQLGQVIAQSLVYLGFPGGQHVLKSYQYVLLALHGVKQAPYLAARLFLVLKVLVEYIFNLSLWLCLHVEEWLM